MQLDASLASELRVKSQDFYCERYFVSDTLAGTVTTGKEFEVREGVVGPISVDVVNGFIGQETTPDVLFHDVAVVKSLSGGFSILSGYNPSDVAITSDSLGRVSFGKLDLVLQSPEQGSAFDAAQATASSQIAAGLSHVCNGAVTLNANKPLFGARFPLFSFIFPEALVGAVHRLLTPLLSVRRSVRWLHRKVRSAPLANKSYLWDMCRRASVFCLPGSNAWASTKLSFNFSKSSGGELCTTLKTRACNFVGLPHLLPQWFRLLASSESMALWYPMSIGKGV